MHCFSFSHIFYVCLLLHEARIRHPSHDVISLLSRTGAVGGGLQRHQRTDNSGRGSVRRDQQTGDKDATVQHGALRRSVSSADLLTVCSGLSVGGPQSCTTAQFGHCYCDQFQAEKLMSNGMMTRRPVVLIPPPPEMKRSACVFLFVCLLLLRVVTAVCL